MAVLGGFLNENISNYSSKSLIRYCPKVKAAGHPEGCKNIVFKVTSTKQTENILIKNISFDRNTNSSC